MLREALVSMGNDVHLLDKWYRKDTNKVWAMGNNLHKVWGEGQKIGLHYPFQSHLSHLRHTYFWDKKG